MLQVCIVGVGLIGGSLGQALRKIRKNGARAYRVTGLGPAKSSLKRAQALGAIDAYSTNPADVIPQADVIVICTPVQSIVPATAAFLNDIKPGAVVTDAGSVKGTIEKEMQAVLRPRPDVTFVGAHPLAGSEKSGVAHAHANLFKNAVCVLTKNNLRVAQLWKDVGCEIVVAKAKLHDEILALTSHLPHLLAFALFGETMRMSKKSSLVRKFMAGSFLDMTRIAASEPTVWQGILELNRTQLIQVKKKFNQAMDQILQLKSGRLHAALQKISQEKQRWQK